MPMLHWSAFLRQSVLALQQIKAVIFRTLRMRITPVWSAWTAEPDPCRSAGGGVEGVMQTL